MTNQKLEGRAVRILQAASGKSVSAAEHALRSARHNMRVGLIMLRRGLTRRPLGNCWRGRREICGRVGRVKKLLHKDR